MSSTTIVCTDGSDLAIAAAIAGLSVLAPSDRLVIVTVVPEPALTLPYDASGMGGAVITPDEAVQIEQDLLAGGTEIVERTAAAVGVTDYESRILMGGAGRAVCELAEELAATVVLLGSRGNSGLKRALLGSVSDHVVRHAPCPVLVVPAS
ncbi:MAG TPA: universal stress protein [Candidatus Nanopelagicales bacterium]|jgi:nucleotide-binding universal stress UspA family protein